MHDINRIFTTEDMLSHRNLHSTDDFLDFSRLFGETFVRIILETAQMVRQNLVAESIGWNEVLKPWVLLAPFLESHAFGP